MTRDGTSGRRLWRFATAELDERSWSLVVDGARVPMEKKPLQLLRLLLVRDGGLVGKDELMDAVWPGVAVVEGSLSTAVLKLRKALGDTARDRPIIETVRGVGYRIAVPVELSEADAPGARSSPVREGGPGRRRWAGVLVAAAVAGALAWRLGPGAPPATDPLAVREALRTLDVDRVERLIRAGWRPNAFLDGERNNAINVALNVCEWDPGHDRRRLLLLVRTLMEGGARIDIRNIWGDTAYSIASARRYCGPGHPVTIMLRKLCYEGLNPPGDRCLADYDRAAKTN